MALTNFFTTGGTTAQPVGTVPVGTVPAVNPLQGLGGAVAALAAPAQPMTGAQTVQGNLASFMNPNSELIQQARLNGQQMAQQRGGINSSIAAGAAERSALDSASALAAQATAIDQQRETVTMDNWLNTQNFNRAMFGNFQQGAFQNSLKMLDMLTQASMNDPELFTPDIVSGMSNFFQMNSADILKRYFG